MIGSLKKLYKNLVETNLMNISSAIKKFKKAKKKKKNEKI